MRIFNFCNHFRTKHQLNYIIVLSRVLKTMFFKTYSFPINTNQLIYCNNDKLVHIPNIILVVLSVLQ